MAGMHASKGMVVFCQHGLADPLVGPLMLDYVLRMRRQGGPRHVLFITEEPPNAVVPVSMIDELTKDGVRWLPLRYDVGGNQWLQRMRNLWRMLWATWAFTRKHRGAWLIGYLSFGGSYAIIASLLGLGPCAVVCFEPHSRYMIELGLWGERSMRVRITSWLERVQMGRSAAIVVPTTAVRDLVAAHRTSGNVVLQGITIDVERSRFDPLARARIRALHGWTDEPVLVYVGKFGGIYHTVDDHLRFMSAVASADPEVRFLIISQHAGLDRVRQHASFVAIADRVVLQPPVIPAELHLHLSAADVGVVAIPPTPAQAFRTPVKSAHYWAAGLPLVIARGVSDDATIADRGGTGIVLDDLPMDDATGFTLELRSLLGGDRGALRERCIATAMRYRDTRNMVDQLMKIVR